jgi:fatty acid desaturase
MGLTQRSELNAHIYKNGLSVVGSPRLGGMVRHATLSLGNATDDVMSDGRLVSSRRDALRQIPSVRNGVSVVSVFAQTALLIYLAVRFGPIAWLPVFVLMGRAHAQFASLMHEAAHRLLFRNRTLNDFVGRWLIGYPAFTNTDAYRRVHMAHHREEFGPNEPDIALYANYPISAASWRRKLVRDAQGRTGLRLLRDQLRGARSEVAVVRQTLFKILAVQAVLIVGAIVAGYWWVYPLFWLLPYLTVWRVINRLRSVAEHGGLMASDDRRIATHSVEQHWAARFFLVPFNIGFHLAHHVDAGVPFRNLPKYHQMLTSSSYVPDQYPNYRSLWSALHS